MEETLFSNVNDELLNNYREAGYSYVDYNYINIFRWLWNEKHIHPNILCFPGDPTNRYRVSLHNPFLGKEENDYGENYDGAIIWVVKYVGNNLKDFKLLGN